MKDYVKVSVNLSIKHEEELKKIIDESSYFGLNRTILINRGIELVIKEEKRKKKCNKKRGY